MQVSLDTAMERTFSVSEFGQLLGEVIDLTFPHDVWIQGEIRGIRRAQSGHVYFDLVDASPEPGRSSDAVLSVVLFESTKRTVNNAIKRSGGGMRMDDGVAVRIRAVPNFYAPQGKLSLRMTGIDPDYTLGQLAASKDALLRRLAVDGLLDRNGQLPYPLVPLRIGLVTAASSAAAADFMHELEGSGVSFQVTFCPITVQGTEAPRQIAAALATCEKQRVEVIAIVRGGGAKTDLATFDDEIVARAIAACNAPVITGIGHEIDTSVADQVAAMAFKTPTACAAHLVHAAQSAERSATSLWQAISNAAAQQLTSSGHNLTTAARSVRDQAGRVVGLANTRIAVHLTTVSRESRHQLELAAANMDRSEDRARLLDPARALARGWSITTDADGVIVRSVQSAPAGTRLATRVADGHIVSVVEPEEKP